MRRAAILLALAGLACLPAAAAAATPPAAEYLTPHPLRNHEATLRFTVDPEGLATTWELEYGREAGEYFPNFEIRNGELPAGEGPVTREVTVPAFFEGGLLAGTEYHWRVVAESAAGKTEGPDETFTTPNGPAPVTTTLPASEQTLSTAVLHGAVDPEGALLTSCRFHVNREYFIQHKGWSLFDTIENTPLGFFVPCDETPAEIGAGTAPVPVQATVTELEPEPWEFRLEAANEYEDSKFTEAEAIGPVVVNTFGAEPVGASKATVHGWVYKHYYTGAEYWLEYGIGSLWHKTPATTLPTLAREFEPEVTLTCLRPETEYAYRFAGANAAGTVYGPIKTFETLPGESSCSGNFVTTQIVLPPGELPPPAASSKATAHRRKHRKHRRSGLRHNAGIVAPRQG